MKYFALGVLHIARDRLPELAKGHAPGTWAVGGSYDAFGRSQFFLPNPLHGSWESDAIPSP